MRSIRYRPTVHVYRSVRQDHVPGNLALKPRIVANIDLRDLLINKGQRAITLISSFTHGIELFLVLPRRTYSLRL